MATYNWINTKMARREANHILNVTFSFVTPMVVKKATTTREIVTRQTLFILSFDRSLGKTGMMEDLDELGGDELIASSFTSCHCVLLLRAVVFDLIFLGRDGVLHCRRASFGHKDSMVGR